MKKGAGFLFLVLSSVLLAGNGAVVDAGVEQTVQIFNKIVANEIRTEAKAFAEFGAEGLALFNAVKAIRIAGNAGNLGGVNYDELSKTLSGKGVTGSQWVKHIEQVAAARKVVSMNDLLVASNLPQPRRIDIVAVTERMATGKLSRYRMPANDTDRALQSSIAQALLAVENGSKLCDDVAACRRDFLGALGELDRMGGTSRPMTIAFFEDAASGFPGEPSPYTGDRLNTIARNFFAYTRAAKDLDSIQPVGVATCIKTGKPSLN